MQNIIQFYFLFSIFYRNFEKITPSSYISMNVSYIILQKMQREFFKFLKIIFFCNNICGGQDGEIMDKYFLIFLI